MTDPYSINIFVHDGHPDGLKIVEAVNFRGKVFQFQRSRWSDINLKERFRSQGGVYILVGSYVDDVDDDALPDDALPVIYIGQGSNVEARIETHIKDEKKEWWHKCVVITSPDNFLNTAQTEWLETNLVQEARTVGLCRLDNKQDPKKDTLSESQSADMRIFMKQILQILPLIGVYCFEKRTPIKTSISQHVDSPEDTDEKIDNMIVVPTREEGFKRFFLEDNSWHPLKIAWSRLEQIKYIAAYQAKPTGAITHYARVESIEPFEDSGKYRVIFAEKAIKLDKPIPIGDLSASVPFQRSRYTSLAKFRVAEKSGRMRDLFDL